MPAVPRTTLRPFDARLARALLLLLMMLAYLAWAPVSLVHSDLARDLKTGAAILEGQSFPLLGPPLAGRLHLGSGWFYLLALLQALGGGWLGTVVLLAGLAALQFPLAYLAGKAWAGRETGLLWAALLLLPSWSLFEQVFPTHTQLTSSCSLLMALATLRWVRTGKSKYLGLSGLAFGVAMHAHPTALVLGAVPLLAMLWAWRRGRLRVLPVLGFGFALVLPFAPMLVDVLRSGSGLPLALGGYLGARESAASGLADLGGIAWQLSGGALVYWFSGILGGPTSLAWGLGLAQAALTLAAGIGVLRLAWRNESWARAALGVLGSGLLLLVLLRAAYPYYMLTALRVALLGAVALGLASLFAGTRHAGAWRGTLGAGCLALYAAVTVGVYPLARQGAWPFAFVPLFDVKSAWNATVPLALSTAASIEARARWLCQGEPRALHGSLAVSLQLDYGAGTPNECGAGAFVLAGPDPGRRHWVGLARAMWRHLGREPEQRLGVFGLVRAAPSAELAAAERSVKDGGYLPIPNDLSPPKQKAERQFIWPAGQDLLITHLGFPLVLDPIIRIEVNGRELAPLAQDRNTWVYRCTACPSASARIDIRAVDPKLVDALLF
ncbi:MAG: hypothetical protein HYZ17_06405 [Betaproteobacteria bacterium]|nr:hypothetical protein [Betaproteobacteria bacterium]